MRLPIEVSEAVIDQASDNVGSLRHLSLTCTEFLPRSRYHLFISIIIKTREQMLSSFDFVDAHPWLIPLVHKITIWELNKQIPDRPLDLVPVHLLTRFPNLSVWSMTSFSDSSHSFHHSALRCYQKCSSRIHYLQLFGICFEGISDFTGLVSAFTSIHTLTCSWITFRKEEENDSSQVTFRSNTFSRHPPISALHLDTRTNIRAIEYLLANSGDTLHNLNVEFASDDLEYPIERLENAMRFWPSRLSSLTLVVSRFREDLPKLLHSCAKIVQGIEKSHLRDVRVEFEAQPIAELGCCLSRSGPSLDAACKTLEDTVLVIPNSRILVHFPDRYYRRVGRAKFWWPVIKRAFPRCNERGLLTLASTTEKLPGTPDPPGHERRVTSLVISHDSRHAATASDDGTIVIWDLSSGMVLKEWLAHGEGVKALALSPDSRRLVSAGGHTLNVWAIDHDVQKVAELEGHTGTVVDCAWSPDGALIASGSRCDTIRVWDSATHQQRDLLGLRDHNLFRLQFSPDSRHLAWISRGEVNCCIWEPFKGGKTTWLRSHPDLGEVLAFSFDLEGRRIATAYSNTPRYGVTTPDTDPYVIRIWDVATGAALAVLSGYPHRVRSVGRVSFSPDGKTLLSASSDDGFAVVWDAVSREQLGLLKVAESEGIASACYSPDGKYVAYGMNKGRVGVCRTDDLQGPCVAEFTEHSSGVEHIAFSPNGKFLVSADWDGIVHIRPLLKFMT